MKTDIIYFINYVDFQLYSIYLNLKWKKPLKKNKNENHSPTK